MPPAVGQLAYAGFGKEITPGVGVTSSYWAGFDSCNPQAKNTKISLPGGKKRPGQKFAPIGPYDFTASLSATPDLDVIGALLAWGFGAQSTPTPAVAYQTALTAATVVGNTNLSVTAGTGSNALLIPGTTTVVVGYGTANAETLIVAGNSANLIATAATAKAHAVGDPIVILSSVAYSSTISLANLAYLQSFTFEESRNYDTIDHLGAVIDSIKLGWQPGGLLKPDFSLVAMSELKNASPATPAFSVLNPLQADASPGTVPLLNGVPFAAGTFVKAVDVTLNNNLNKNYRGTGSRYVQGFPVGQRMASGTLKAVFADRSLYELFLGAVGATGPQSAIGPVALQLPIASGSLADPAKGVPYSLTINLPALFPTSDQVQIKNYGDLEQTFAFDAGASTASGLDDISLTIVTTASTSY